MLLSNVLGKRAECEHLYREVLSWPVTRFYRFFDSIIALQKKRPGGVNPAFLEGSHERTSTIIFSLYYRYHDGRHGDDPETATNPNQDLGPLLVDFQ